MNRRSFLRTIGALPAVVAVPALLKQQAAAAVNAYAYADVGDAIHLNDAGFALMRQAVYDTIRREWPRFEAEMGTTIASE